MRVNSLRWPFVKTPGSPSGNDLHPLEVSEQTAKDWFNRTREWQVNVSVDDGTNSTAVEYKHTFETDPNYGDLHLNEKRRILARNGINESLEVDGWVGAPSGVLNSGFILCSPDWSGPNGSFLPPSIGEITQMYQAASRLVRPMLVFSLYLFVGGAFDEYVSTSEFVIQSICDINGRTKRSFSGTFAGLPITVWYSSAAPSIAWSLDVSQFLFFPYAERSGENPIYDVDDGTTDLNPVDYPDPLA